jgi:hypothetical protein
MEVLLLFVSAVQGEFVEVEVEVEKTFRPLFQEPRGLIRLTEDETCDEWNEFRVSDAIYCEG